MPIQEVFTVEVMRPGSGIPFLYEKTYPTLSGAVHHVKVANREGQRCRITRFTRSNIVVEQSQIQEGT